jgi:transcriptional regulator with XRE-family HTH domain
MALTEQYSGHVTQTRAYSNPTRRALQLLGERIRIHRTRRKMTLEDLAERVGVSRTTMRHIELGRPSVRIGVVFEAAIIVGFALSTMTSVLWRARRGTPQSSLRYCLGEFGIRSSPTTSESRTSASVRALTASCLRLLMTGSRIVAGSGQAAGIAGRGPRELLDGGAAGPDRYARGAGQRPGDGLHVLRRDAADRDTQ